MGYQDLTTKIYSVVLSIVSEPLQGQHISLAQQVEQVMDTFQQLMVSMGEDAANDLISNSMFYISIGSNDYIHYYLIDASNVQSLYLPWDFNEFLAQTLKQEIKVIIFAFMPKVLFMYSGIGSCLLKAIYNCKICPTHNF